MTTRYVGPGGSDSNNGLTWATRKLTLNGVEDSPVAAGDTVYVAPGTYREQLTVDVSGTAGNPIAYIGDYDGSHTDGVGGEVRITGSDNDQTITRTACIWHPGSTHNYRTFQNFKIDMATYWGIAYGSNWVIDKCIFDYSPNGMLVYATDTVISNCVFKHAPNYHIKAYYPDASTNVQINRCVFEGGAYGIYIEDSGGITVNGCKFDHQAYYGIATISSAGRITTVKNCTFENIAIYSALYSASLGELVEDYNSFFNNAANRTNVAVGANSVAYPFLAESRWFFQLVNAAAANQVITPFDLASYSPLVGFAASSPTATDMRGTGAVGGTQEIGPLEYDSTLSIEGGGGGGAVSISPICGNVG